MNSHKKRLTCMTACLAMLGAPSAASGAVYELGQTEQVGNPGCPDEPCLVLSRTTGYQARFGTQRALFKVPTDGRIVAWAVRLGKPSAPDQAKLSKRFRGESSAGITILRLGPKRTARVLRASPVRRLTPYLGTRVQFPLVRSLKVRKGYVVALTVPTWAPVMHAGLDDTTSWTATRHPKRCANVTRQSAQLTSGTLTRFACSYGTVRLTYSATLVTSPTK